METFSTLLAPCVGNSPVTSEFLAQRPVMQSYDVFSDLWLNKRFISKQDRRWIADKPSAALDPYIPTWLTTSPANHRPANFSFFFFFYIQRKLWKVVQPQVQLWGIKFKFEVPILWLFQVQIIINIIY